MKKSIKKFKARRSPPKQPLPPPKVTTPQVVPQVDVQTMPTPQVEQPPQPVTVQSTEQPQPQPPVLKIIKPELQSDE